MLTPFKQETTSLKNLLIIKRKTNTNHEVTIIQKQPNYRLH